MNVYTEIEVDDYVRVVYCENSEVNLKSFIAIHNTNLGPSLGGCRLWNYKTKGDVLVDALRLSKGMTYKNALAGLKLGGGKSVIWSESKTPELLEAMGEFVEYIGGDYIIAEDVGINSSDIEIIRKKTKYSVDPDIGDPGPTTAKGVFFGIRTACKFKYGVDNLNGIIVSVQGVGSVGLSLVKELINDGAFVFVSDINEVKLKKAVDLGALPVSQGSLYELKGCHVFSPCALGGIINDETIPLLNYEIIAGAANNQLLEQRHGQALLDAGILYAPDFVINSGGVMVVSSGTENGFRHEAIEKKVNNISSTLIDIFERSNESMEPTNIIAEGMAKKILGIKNNKDV